MPGSIGWQEILIVLIIALVVFGPKKLPEMGRSLGKGIREFKDGIGGAIDGDHHHTSDAAPSPADEHVATAVELPPAAPPPPGAAPAAPAQQPASTAGLPR